VGDASDRPEEAKDETTQIRTFLIADVRGYTLFTQQHGDEAAGELAKRFAKVTREGVKARGGTVLELRGDEALVVFGSARQAIRTAVELQARFVEETIADPALPLRVGIGIDAGEAVPVEGGYRGRALNLAARLCGQAGPGEVLASREAVHLAGGIEAIKYIDRGSLHLKGLTDPVHAIRVVPEGRDPADLLKPFAPPTRRPRTDRRMIVGGVAVAVAIALVLTLLPSQGGGRSAIEARPGMALVELADGPEGGSTPVGRITIPGFPLYVDGHFWVDNFFPASYLQIDPVSGRPLREISAPPKDPEAEEAFSETPFAVDGNTLWATAGDDVVKIDIEREREVDRFPLGEILGGEGHAEGVVLGAGSLWVSRSLGQIARIDPTSGRLEHRWDDIFPHLNIAFADGSLWVADDAGIVRIDPETSRIFRADLTGNARVAAGGGFGWTSDENKGVVYKIDPSGSIAATYSTGLGAGHMSFADGTLWVANQDVGTVTGIDAVTGKTTTLRFGHPVTTLAVGDGRLLLGLLEGRSVEDSIDALTGDVVKLIAYRGEIDNGEPALDTGLAALQIAFATCAKLLNYPDEPAPAGWQLGPEVATAMPEISDGGRTYTFTVGSGYRFSPPENERVTAETFRYSIERALSPRLGEGTPGPMFIDDIVGESAFRNGDADTISGLRASGNTLSIRLVAPSADFLERLALPFFCPVPTDTPLVPGGLGRGEVGVAGGVHFPAAGPYYIADHNNDEYVILKRNPNYRGPRPHALDAIVIREGIDAGLAVDRIEHEGWDGISMLFDPLLDPGGPLDQRWGPESGADEDEPTYVAAPSLTTGYVAFNASSEPFSDPSVRRTAALALDRSALARVYAQAPTSSLLPPTVPGTEEITHSSLRPRLAAARRAMAGRHVSALMAVFADCEPCMTEAQAIRDELAPIGIDVRTQRVSDVEQVFRRGSPFDLFDGGTGVLYPDPAVVLSQLFLRDLPTTWLPAYVERDVRRVSEIVGPRRQEMAIRLADRLATDDVPVVAIGNGSIGTVIGPRLGCRVFPPLGFGIDLAALCLEG
jgi:class 3 adenylate cyclase/ABC-type transport system substrate-binding protein